MNKHAIPLTLVVAAALTLTGCADTLREPAAIPAATAATASSVSATPVAQSTSTPTPSETSLGWTETCDQLAVGDQALVYRLARFQASVKESDTLGFAHYSEASDLVSELDDLEQLAPYSLQANVAAMKIYPQNLVDAIDEQDGEGSVSMDHRIALSTVMDTATECLTTGTPEMNEFRDFIYEHVVGEPLEMD
ncbi:hypothetical protein [uncultured Citricoccus sp.]|uniref:hypothetical protein n=1 Tax=uncultured Citricoccus sp. TaxID=614031 RepID=UPI0026176E73|nr:hypothetical protein [uncultured Citricoccus sp.]